MNKLNRSLQANFLVHISMTLHQQQRFQIGYFKHPNLFTRVSWFSNPSSTISCLIFTAVVAIGERSKILIKFLGGYFNQLTPIVREVD